MRRVILLLIRGYQVALSPAFAALGAECRFHPSCSDYAREAFERLPAWKAGIKTIKRLLKCGPWNEGGIDRL